MNRERRGFLQTLAGLALAPLVAREAKAADVVTHCAFAPEPLKPAHWGVDFGRGPDISIGFEIITSHNEQFAGRVVRCIDKMNILSVHICAPDGRLTDYDYLSEAAKLDLAEQANSIVWQPQRLPVSVLDSVKS